MKIERLQPELQFKESDKSAWIEQRKNYYINVEHYEDEQEATEQAEADYEEEVIPTLQNWTRDFTALDDKGKVIAKYDDIIYKKLKIQKLFEEDPDLLEMLGKPEKLVALNGMTDEEKQEIADHNDRISEPEIIPWLKLNGVVKTVSNKVLFDIYTERADYDDPAFSRQFLIIMCLVDETAIDTDFGIPRVDLVAYIVKDLLNRTDWLGMNAKLYSDEPKIVDNSFYCRELRFLIKQPNYANSQAGLGNRYDHFR